MDMLNAFEREMRRLSEGGKEFARCYPEQGRLLNLSRSNDRDPYVERLLEGVAYLTAGVRQEVERSFAEVHEQMLECLCPQLIEPSPSTVTLQLGLDDSRLNAANIPAGSVFYSQPVSDASIRMPFISQLPVQLRPIQVSSSQWEPLSGGGSQLRLAISSTPETFQDVKGLSPMLLWLDTQSSFGLLLREALLRGLDKVELRPVLEGRLSTDAVITNAGISFEPALPRGYSDLFDTPLPSSSALERLRAYFLARDQLCFINMLGLDRVTIPAGCKLIELICKLARPASPEAATRTAELRYGCIPAINLNRGSADPVRLPPGVADFPVSSQTEGGGSRVVHRVVRVEGRENQSGSSIVYSPLATWGFQGHGKALYRSVRRDRGSSGRGNIELRLDPESAQYSQTLSVEVLYSNGDLPRLYLTKGDIDSCSEQLPEGVTVKNLDRPRPFRPAPVDAADIQALASLMRSDVERLADSGALRNLLTSIASTGNGYEVSAVQAIGDIQWQTAMRWRKGVLEQGVRVTMPLDSRYLPGRGEGCLLAELIHGLLLEWAPLDRFIELLLIFEPSGEEELWTIAP